MTLLGIRRRGDERLSTTTLCIRGGDAADVGTACVLKDAPRRQVVRVRLGVPKKALFNKRPFNFPRERCVPGGTAWPLAKTRTCDLHFCAANRFLLVSVAAQAQPSRRRRPRFIPWSCLDPHSCRLQSGPIRIAVRLMLPTRCLEFYSGSDFLQREVWASVSPHSASHPRPPGEADGGVSPRE